MSDEVERAIHGQCAVLDLAPLPEGKGDEEKVMGSFFARKNSFKGPYSYHVCSNGGKTANNNIDGQVFCTWCQCHNRHNNVAA